MDHPYRVRLTFWAMGWLAWAVGLPAARAAVPDPVSPAAFLPGGMLGVQVGGSWAASKKNAAFGRLTCRSSRAASAVFDEVCFFKTSNRVAGARIHDGFIVRRGDRLVLVGTGIAIKNADDPLAEAVVRDLESEVHAGFQHTGADVLFVNLPPQRMSAGELAGYSKTAPALLVELEPQGNELAVLYGYLAPVNVFSALASE